MPCFAAAGKAQTLAQLQAQFSLPEQRIDLAQAKLVIDRLIDPTIDSRAVLREVDALVAATKARTPTMASKRGRMDVLLSTLYQPGAWNGNRPFSYDLSDPMGRNRRNKLLSTYLTSRKGNCVSMPILVAILGQRLGLHTVLATAPEHLLVKFVDDQDMWVNVEATAGGYKFDSSYERETGITPSATQNEIYLRPLSPREEVGAMASTLMEHFAAQKNGEALLAVADMALAANGKDTVAMIQKANANYLLLQARYASKYPRPADIPKDKLADFQTLSRENLAWFAKAEQMGWVQPSEAKEQNYLQSIQREKARQR
ncbi:transglutaminase family protein [Xanthomonas hyacinthi]|nr:transglutaminase family protein [Xanthomonas hyacinthi]